MNFFEQELQRLLKNCPDLRNQIITGRVCFAELGEDIRVKLQFVTLGHSNHYEALKATILNRTGGQVDATFLRFQDVWGKKPVNHPNFREGVIPYIWTYNNATEWYAYRPTDSDFRQLAAEVNAYTSVFADRTVTRQQEKESVVQKLRESKPRTAPPKDKPRKTEPER